MGIDIDRVKKALPVEEGKGGRSVIRMRADVGQIVVDCVLRRRSYKEQAIRLSYSDLAQVTRNLMMDKAIAKNSYLAVDAGGPGRAYCDILNDRNVLHTRVTITGGENENETKERGLVYNSVGKVRLLSMLNSALHTGDLKIGTFPLRDELRQELESFEAEITAAGRMRIDGGTDFSHSDAAIAAALAYWLSDSRKIGAVVGEVPLKGFW